MAPSPETARSSRGRGPHRAVGGSGCAPRRWRRVEGLSPEPAATPALPGGARSSWRASSLPVAPRHGAELPWGRGCPGPSRGGSVASAISGRAHGTRQRAPDRPAWTGPDGLTTSTPSGLTSCVTRPAPWRPRRRASAPALPLLGTGPAACPQTRLAALRRPLSGPCRSGAATRSGPGLRGRERRGGRVPALRTTRGAREPGPPPAGSPVARPGAALRPARGPHPRPGARR